MNNVRAVAPALRDVRVPEPLREVPGWLIWRFEHFVGEAKPRKIPFWADGTRRHGTQGGPQDRDRLTTFVAARDAAMRLGFDGVGFAPLPNFGFSFLDIDKCVDIHGNIPKEIEQIVSRTYAEYSPSGTGIRVALRGDLGNHKSYATPDQYGFETFSASGFVTFTGNILPSCEVLGYEDRVAPVDEHVEGLCYSRFGVTAGATFDPDDFMAGREPRLGLTVEQMQTYLSYLDPSMGREPWLRVGMALHHECEGDDTGFELWDEWSSEGETYPGTEGLRYQWESLRPAPGKRQVTMASVIKMAKDAGYRPYEGPSREQVLAKAEEIRAELPQKSTGRFGPVPIYDLTQREPMEWLIKGVLPKAQLGILFGASGSGKAQPLDEPVLTDRGWRSMGDIREGDYVIGSAGLPVCVRGVYPQGYKDEWELTLSNGEKVRCCGEHLWTVRKPGKRWETLTTEAMASKWTERSRWQLPIVAPVSFAHDPNPLPLDPYLMGALLGDGGMTAYVGFSSVDEEVLDNVKSTLPAGHELVKRGGSCDYQIVTPRGQPNHVWTALRLLGLAGRKSPDKFVPKEYMLAPPSARLALLQGLMDTDGYVSDGNGRTAVFSSSSRALTESVAELVKSLGGLCRPITVKQTRGLPAHSVNFRLCEGAVPFRLRRKAERCNRGGLKLHLTVTSIKPTGRSVLMQCISVDANDSLYVTTGYTLTHNTFVALDIAFAIARGIEWRGRRSQQGLVVTIAAEGGSGLGKRGEAYARYHDFDLRGVRDMQVITAAPNFLDADDISEVIAEIKNIGSPAVIVVDTLAQVSPGANENTSEDMGRVLANLRLLHEATGAMILVVHHAGKDLSKGSRGWSGLKAAADVQIEVIRYDGGDREIIIEKMKDGEDGLRWGFKLEIIELGIDTDGDLITSCVAIEAEVSAQKQDMEDRKGTKRRGRMENHVLEVMATFGSESIVSALELIDKAADMLPAPEEGKRDIRRQSVTRAINSLSREKDGPLKMEGGKIIFYE